MPGSVPLARTKTPAAWLESTRGDKLKSFPCLPKLLQQLVVEAEGTIKSAEESAATIKEMLDAMTGAPTANARADTAPQK